jgi:Fe-S oxidoreductase
MIIYFKGCVVREKLTYISDATEAILKRAGVDYTVLDNESCCGSFLMRTGFMEDAIEVMSETMKKFQDPSLEDIKILVSCAGCYNTIKNDYNELFGVELDVIHSSQLINQLIIDGDLDVKKTSKKVTYHDPCHLGRHSNLYEAPREVINKTCTLVEMNRNRERSRCCGAGAGVRSAYPDTALKVASKRIQDAEDTGAEILVTSCSFCILNLENALENTLDDPKNGIEDNNKRSVSRVIDVTELILMGLEDEGV